MEPALLEEARRVVAVGYLGPSDFSSLVDRSFEAGGNPAALDEQRVP